MSNDPVRAGLLALRLTPERVKQSAFGLTLRVFPGAVLPRVLRLWETGRRERALGLAARAPARPRTLRRLARWAAAVERPDTARLLAGRLPPGGRHRARLEAVLARRAAGPAGAAVGRGPGEGPGEVPAPAARRPAGPPVPGRVLHLVTNSPPYRNAGYTVRTLGIVRGQRAAGLDPHVVTRLGFPVAQGVWDGRPVQYLEGVPHHRLLPLLMPAAPHRVLERNAELAARLVERLRPAVLHAATDHPNGRIALALRETYGLPVVYEVRGFLEETWLTQAPGRTPADPAYRRARELETHCMRAADAVITLGEQMRREIVSRGVPPERVHVVPNAVDEEFLRPPPDAGPLRAALGIAPDEPVAGTVATLTPHEGVSTLVRAAAELRRRGGALRVLVVGDGPQLAVVRRQAEALTPPGTVLFTGRVPHAEVRRHLAVLDVFAVPRTADRVCRLVTPLKPVEAMACGLPVLASDLPALAELVTDGVHGRLLPPDDPGAWAEALGGLLERPAERRRMGEAARRRVARDRTWSRAGVRTRDIYRMLGAA